MSGFKIEPDKIPGLCGSCKNAIVQVTQSNKTKVVCGGGEPVFRVMEPIERCSIYNPKSLPKFAKWMEEVAWKPAVIKGEGRRLRTFLHPEDERLEEATRDYFANGWEAAATISKKARKIGMKE